MKYMNDKPVSVICVGVSLGSRPHEIWWIEYSLTSMKPYETSHCGYISCILHGPGIFTQPQRILYNSKKKCSGRRHDLKGFYSDSKPKSSLSQIFCNAMTYWPCLCIWEAWIDHVLGHFNQICDERGQMNMEFLSIFTRNASNQACATNWKYIL